LHSNIKFIPRRTELNTKYLCVDAHKDIDTYHSCWAPNLWCE